MWSCKERVATVVAADETRPAIGFPSRYSKYLGDDA
jgi:hypothetical protein